jgi:hypothetical protein
METLKILATVAAVSISVASFIIARLADSRSKKAEEIRNLLGDKESVAFGALKLALLMFVCALRVDGPVLGWVGVGNRARRVGVGDPAEGSPRVKDAACEFPR